jgi:predicted nucleotidyltransferase
MKKARKFFEKIGKIFGIDYAIIFDSATREVMNIESDVDFGIKLKKLPKIQKFC